MFFENLNIIDKKYLDPIVIRKYKDYDLYFYFLNLKFKSDLLISIINEYVDYNMVWIDLLYIVETKIDGFTCKYEIVNPNYLMQQYCDCLYALEFYINKPYKEEQKINFHCDDIDIIKIPPNTNYFKYILNKIHYFNWKFSVHLTSDIFRNNNIKVIANGIFLKDNLSFFQIYRKTDI